MKQDAQLLNINRAPAVFQIKQQTTERIARPVIFFARNLITLHPDWVHRRRSPWPEDPPLNSAYGENLVRKFPSQLRHQYNHPGEKRNQPLDDED